MKRNVEENIVVSDRPLDACQRCYGREFEVEYISSSNKSFTMKETFWGIYAGWPIIVSFKDRNEMMGYIVKCHKCGQPLVQNGHYVIYKSLYDKQYNMEYWDGVKKNNIDPKKLFKEVLKRGTCIYVPYELVKY